MLRRYEDSLDLLLDRLFLDGAASVRWDDVYVWFGAERLSKGAYREMLKRWEDLCVGHHGYKVAPEVSVLGSKYLMLLRRDLFVDEVLTPLRDLT